MPWPRRLASTTPGPRARSLSTLRATLARTTRSGPSILAGESSRPHGYRRPSSGLRARLDYRIHVVVRGEELRVHPAPFLHLRLPAEADAAGHELVLQFDEVPGREHDRRVLPGVRHIRVVVRGVLVHLAVRDEGHEDGAAGADAVRRVLVALPAHTLKAEGSREEGLRPCKVPHDDRDEREAREPAAVRLRPGGLEREGRVPVGVLEPHVAVLLVRRDLVLHAAL